MSDQVPGQFWQEEDGLHVDTRGLTPPDPAVAILWHIDQPGQTGPITAYLERHPIYLFPELAERDWDAKILSDTPGDVRMVLRPRA